MIQPSYRVRETKGTFSCIQQKPKWNILVPTPTLLNKEKQKNQGPTPSPL